MTTVLYPGSFDPIHLGHLDVIEQSAELFTSPDKGVVVVAVMHNHDKPGGVFTVDERVRLINESAAAAGLADRVTVVTHMVPRCVADALDEQFPGAEETPR